MNWLKERLWEPIVRRKGRLRQAQTERDYWKARLDEEGRKLTNVQRALWGRDLEPSLREPDPAKYRSFTVEEEHSHQRTGPPHEGQTVLPCPDCGSPSYMQTTFDGCLTCRHCGWSKCRLVQEESSGR